MYPCLREWWNGCTGLAEYQLKWIHGQAWRCIIAISLQWKQLNYWGRLLIYKIVSFIYTWTGPPLPSLASLTLKINTKHVSFLKCGDVHALWIEYMSLGVSLKPRTSFDELYLLSCTGGGRHLGANIQLLKRESQVHNSDFFTKSSYFLCFLPNWQPTSEAAYADLLLQWGLPLRTPPTQGPICIH